MNRKHNSCAGGHFFVLFRWQIFLVPSKCLIDSHYWWLGNHWIGFSWKLFNVTIHFIQTSDFRHRFIESSHFYRSLNAGWQNKFTKIFLRITWTVYQGRKNWIRLEITCVLSIKGVLHVCWLASLTVKKINDRYHLSFAPWRVLVHSFY